jgi:sulfite reductase alpha subunit-like flavoprotein
MTPSIVSRRSTETYTDSTKNRTSNPTTTVIVGLDKIMKDDNQFNQQTSPITPSEHIFVLYASQTGNAEQAAKDCCEQLPSHLQHGKSTVTCSHMQLDDFLELEQCQWNRFVIIVSSSYGVGQAPLGGYRFRAFCDAILSADDNHNKFLEGLSFCLLGLGDSKYTTFFQNPNTIHDAMVKAGATLVGKIGTADASGDQLQAIAKWIQGIWTPLQTALHTTPTFPSERFISMQQETIQICRENDPTFMPISRQKLHRSTWIVLPVLVVLVATAIGFWSNL